MKRGGKGNTTVRLLFSPTTKDIHEYFPYIRFSDTELDPIAFVMSSLDKAVSVEQFLTSHERVEPCCQNSVLKTVDKKFVEILLVPMSVHTFVSNFGGIIGLLFGTILKCTNLFSGK